MKVLMKQFGTELITAVEKVANGPYFYIIEMQNETIDGKILLIE